MQTRLVRDDGTLTAANWHSAYREHGPAVLAFLASRLRRREDAEDLLQETFVRAIRAEGRLRDEAKLRPYLMTIAHNLIVNDARRRRPLLFSESSEPSGLAGRLVAERPSPEAQVYFSDLESRLQAVLAKMRPQHRLAFELVILAGHSYREVAEQTGWTLAQVKTNVFRARRGAIAGLSELLPLNPESLQ